MIDTHSQYMEYPYKLEGHKIERYEWTANGKINGIKYLKRLVS